MAYVQDNLGEIATSKDLGTVLTHLNVDLDLNLGIAGGLHHEAKNEEGYRILQRNSDFVMFVVQDNTTMTYGRTYTLINKMSREVVMKEQNEVI